MGILACGILGYLAGVAADHFAPLEEKRGILLPIAFGILGGVLGSIVGARLGFGSVYYLDFRNVLIGTAVALAFVMFYRQLTAGERAWHDQTSNDDA